MTKSLLAVLPLFLLLSCDPGSAVVNPDLPATEDGAVNVIVEIPAGTNLKIEYDKTQNTFLPDQVEGEERVIAFLPYPGNYGFIPSTLMDESRGGDGDALDILVIGSAVPTGTVVRALPVGTLLLRDDGEIDTKIIAVPYDSTQRVLPVDEFKDLLLEFDPARRIIEEWFTHYKGFQQVEFLGWEDEEYAWREVEKWVIK